MTEDHYKNSESYVRDFLALMDSEPQFIEDDVIPLVQEIADKVSSLQDQLDVTDDGPHDRGPGGLVVELGANIIRRAEAIGRSIADDSLFEETTVYSYLKDTADLTALLSDFLVRNSVAIQTDAPTRAHCVRVVNRCLVRSDVMYVLNSIIAILHAKDELDIS